MNGYFEIENKRVGENAGQPLKERRVKPCNYLNPED
jgi:hypothetical protein